MGSGRRIVLVFTGVLVALMAVSFVVVGWESTGKVATAVSALAGVAGVGVAVWAALSPGRRDIRAHGTGEATTRGTGYANTGIDAPASDATSMEVSRTGKAVAEDGGQAISGIRRRDP